MSSEHNVTDNPYVPQNIAAQIQMKLAGRRKRVRHGGLVCSKCLAAPPRPNQRYCVPCHSANSLAGYHRKRLRALAQAQEGEHYAR